MIQIARATDLDLAALEDLNERCLDQPWGRDSLRHLLTSPGAFGFLARVGTSPTGFILCRGAADECELLSFGVQPTDRRRGIGSALLVAALDHATNAGAVAMFAEVAENNWAALNLYRCFGFLTVGHRPGYYRHNRGATSAWTIKCALPPAS